MPADKKLHAVGTGFMAAFVALFLMIVGVNHEIALIWAVVSALTIGALKEVMWDMLLGRGRPEFSDMIANLIGAAPVAALIPFA